MTTRPIKKIIFIEAKPSDVHIFTRVPIPRLGTILLATLLKQQGYDAKCYVETIDELDLEDIMTADAVGISSISSTTPRSYEIAKLLKEAGIPVFMGGAHVTYMTEEALEYCDYVLRGEADDTIVPFIDALNAGEGLEDVAGLSFRDTDGEIKHNKTVSYCKDIDALPIPDFTLVHGLELNVSKKLPITPIMTSRGCPYDCSFCSVTKMFGHKYRFREKETVLAEIKHHMDNGTKWVFFYDDNFTADRERTKELLEAMIERGLTPKWSAQVRVETAKDTELMALMQKSGCHTVYVGFESVNPATLEAYNKKQSVSDIEHCIESFHDYGVNIHGMFVFGSDLDTIDTIHETVHFAKKNNIESVQFLILTPLVGTTLYHDLLKEDRIISRDWTLYDAHHVVFKPKLMTYYELQYETTKATKAFYSRWQIIKRAIKFDIWPMIIKAYGRRMSRQWADQNAYFIEYTRSITNAGKVLELAARKSAEDIKERLTKLKIKGFRRPQSDHK
ncbi:MAG: radical SAM protein [Deltaproteobacteria bacterium]|nr:radical SAM protein [Deltaproteobacteria bacterium]